MNQEYQGRVSHEHYSLPAVDNPRFVGAWLALPAAWLALPAAWPVTPKNRRTLTDGALRRKFW